MKKATTDFGFKQVDSAKKQVLVKQVFDSVANRYDLMNDLMSLGVHRFWKHHAISMCQIRPGHNVLDLATGTGDLALAIAPKVKDFGYLALCDINNNMLQQAQKRLLNKGFVENISIIQANAQSLPFEDNTFDRIMMGFGLRNVTFKEKALTSMYRVLKPGGRLIILEFSHPTSLVFSKLYDSYSFHILPFLGKWIAKDPESYRYLAESIRMHPKQAELKSMILSAGFDSCEYQNLSQGIVAIHQGTKY